MKKKILSFFLVLALMLPFMMNGLVASMLSAAPSGGALESFELHKTYHKMAVGKTATFSIVNPVPADTSTSLGGNWSSSNPAVVKMTGNVPGQVKSVADGVATITCDINGVTASVTIVVGDGIAAESFALSPERTTMETGGVLTLQMLNLFPANANNMATAKWFSSNADVVAFTNISGEIAALKPGYSTITCQIGAVKAYTKVFVENASVPTEEQKLSFADMEVYAMTWDNPGSPSVYATDMELLFNQQSADPMEDPSVSAHDNNRYWNYGGTDRYMLIDLGAEYDITELYMWNRFPMNGYADFTLWHATSLGDWDTAFTVKSSKEDVFAKLNADDSVWTKAFASVYQHDYDMWVSETINAKVRYLIFSSVYTGNGSGGTIYTEASFSEWIFYGTPVAAG